MYHWEVVSALFKENPFVKQHIDSYNEFIDKKIKRIVAEQNGTKSEDRYTIKFHDVKLGEPSITDPDGSAKKITPAEARLRSRTYAAPIFFDLSIEENGTEMDRDTIRGGDIPVMLKSKLCYLHEKTADELIGMGEDPNEHGGYFIVNGTERVLVSMEDLAPNRLIVSKEVKGGKHLTVGRIFSSKGGFRAKIVLDRKSDGTMYLQFPASPKNLNLFIVLKALGLDGDKKVLESFSDKPEVINDVLLNLEQIETVTTEDALDYIGKRVAAGQPTQYRKQRAEYVLDNYLLPHIGVNDKTRDNKAHFLSRMAERCISVAYGKRTEDDKDHYSNKRLKISGTLMDDLFRQALGYFIKDLKYQIERAYTRGRKIQIKTLTRPDAMTDRIKYGMATGTWPGNRQGVSQLLDRLSYMSTMSHLRRVVSPLSKTQQHFEARDLHPTHWGKICPNETPEGQNVGLIKNMAIGCFVSAKLHEGLEKDLEEMGVKLLTKL
ncbi:MAG: DNA-directed RNA polymerase subunit B'' [Candidatus Micrarchaeota archaeon]